MTEWDYFSVRSVTFRPRPTYDGREMKPGMKELEGRELTVKTLWQMGEDDPYPGEWALGAADRGAVFPEMPDVLWIASGDVEAKQ